MVREVRLVHDTALGDHFLQELLTVEAGRPLDLAELDRDLRRLYGLDLFERVGYELFPVPEGGVVLEIQAKQRRSGRDYMQFGMSLQTDFENTAVWGILVRLPYCSRVCCMYTAKHARLYKHKVHDGQAYIFYMDIRSTGKGYEEFIQQSMEEEGILYLGGRVSRIFRDGDKVVVWGADTLTGKKIEIAADMVVLATAIVPQNDAKVLAGRLDPG